MSRWLARPRRWQVVRRLNGTVMTVYLWHMVPAVLLAVALYPTGVMPQPAVGSALWWETRPIWLGALALILVPVVLGVMRAERPMLRLPAGIGSPGRWSGPILLAGTAAAMYGLARLAISGFAPGGILPALVLAVFGCGVTGTLLSGRPKAGVRRNRAASRGIARRGRAGPTGRWRPPAPVHPAGMIPAIARSRRLGQAARLDAGGVAGQRGPARPARGDRSG